MDSTDGLRATYSGANGSGVSASGGDGFGVDADRLGALGATVSAVAERLGPVQVVAVTQALAAAMPGSLTAAVAGELERAWSTSVEAVVSGLSAHATALRVAAEMYRQTETAAGQDIATAAEFDVPTTDVTAVHGSWRVGGERR